MSRFSSTDSKLESTVRETLEALRNDLESTAAVLRRANQNKYDYQQTSTQSTMTSSSRPRNDLQDLERLLDDYTSQRGHQTGSGRPTVESLLGELDNAVPNGDVMSLSVNGHGVTNVPKGDCAACNKPIVGQVVIALNKMFHPEHFNCAHCGQELGHQNFFERSGRVYCENDYHNLFSPRCAYCNGPIKDKCITAMDKTWHPEHFICAHCGKEFGDDGYHERDGRPYCRKDFFSTFTPRCRGCQKLITSNYITAVNTHWHPDCFVSEAYETTFEDWKRGAVDVTV